jgi:hypothetical protein
MTRAAIERRLRLAETAAAGVPDRRVENGRAVLAAAGVDLATLSVDDLQRIECLAETWPPELGDVPVSVIRACLGATE